MPCPTRHDRLRTTRIKCPSLGCTFTTHPNYTSACPNCGLELGLFASQPRQIICHCCESGNDLTRRAVYDIVRHHRPPHSGRTSIFRLPNRIRMSAKCRNCGYPLAGPENVRCWGPEGWERVVVRWRVNWWEVVDEQEARRAFVEVVREMGEMQRWREKGDKEENESVWKNVVAMAKFQFKRGVMPEIVVRRVGERLMRRVEERGEQVESGG